MSWGDTMKKSYEKPTAEVIVYEIEEPIMDSLLIPSWEIDEDEDLG